MGRRDLPLAPDPRSGAEMTLLRMLAFKPAAGSADRSGSGGSADTPATAQPRKVPSARKPAAKAAEAGTKSWQDPDWGALMSELGLTGSLRMLAGNCALDKREGRTVYFSLDPRSESLLTRQRKDALAEALSKHFGEELAVDIRIAKSTPETPHERENRVADKRIVAAQKSLESDPNVQTLKNMFGAELKTESIEPLDSSRSD
jgi:DNA polymerase-3 subunit gamma/tau